jgi:Fic family protein
MYEKVSSMEPMLPTQKLEHLEDLSIELCAKATALTLQFRPELIRAIGDLVRSMNCFYSNLIEGHYTYPIDIDRALKEQYDTNPEKRDLQFEAKAHIEVQKEIDDGNFWSVDNLSSKEFISKIHYEFYTRLPDSLRYISYKNGQDKEEVIPGALRDKGAAVGEHIAPLSSSLNAFLKRFEDTYQLDKHSKLKQIIVVAASHHRLLWIHPFADGNGRAVRLFSHALLKKLGLGSSLWSVSRGLARNSEEYRRQLVLADQPRKGDLDGRGNLSESGLKSFCEFFLKICIDQVDYMSSLLEPKEILRRMELYIEDEARAKRLDIKAYFLLREAYYQGEFARGKAEEITGYKSTKARQVLSDLISKGFLQSDSPKGPVRLAFPVSILERWFPRLYPI